MNKVNLTKAQADYLLRLKAESDRAALTFSVALRAAALAGSDGGGTGLHYELDGPTPFVEETREAEPDA